MNNNYIFKQIISALQLTRHTELIIEIFELGENSEPVSRSKIKKWRTYDTANPSYSPLPDEALEAFLFGLHEANRIKLIEVIHDI